MQRVTVRKSFLLSIFCMAIASAWLCGDAVASGFRNPPEGASALGRAGGRIAFADDASAISANPANLVEIEDRQVLFSLTVPHAEVEYSGISGSGETRSPWKFLPNAFLVWPTSREGVVGGLGIITPYGQSTEWEKDGPFRYTAPYFVELRMLDFKPTLAFPFGENFSFGIGADLIWSDLDFRQVFPWAGLTGDPLTPDGEVKLSGDGYGLGGSAAVTWKITGNQRLALTYRSPVNVEYSGDTKLAGQPAAAGQPPMPGLPGRSDFETTIRYPSVWALGYGLRLTDKVRAAVDIEWVEFSRYDRLDIDAGELSALMPAATIRQDWKDAWTFGFGMDFEMSDCMILRAGYSFLESPIPDETLAPTLPDADRHAVSVGLGYRKSSHVLDMAFVWSIYEDRNVSGNQNPFYDGQYENRASILSLSYGYSF